MPRFKKGGREEDRRGRPERRFMDARKEDLKLVRREKRMRQDRDRRRQVIG